MSTGAGRPVEGLAAAPVPAGRAHILARLEAERRQADGCFEHDRAAEIGAQIALLSRGVPASPARETASRPKRPR